MIRRSKSNSKAARAMTLMALALSPLLFIPGCGRAMRRSALMEQHSDKIKMGAPELRSRTRALITEASGVIEESADEILSLDPPPPGKREALSWKSDGIALMQEALFRSDPLAGLIDAWAFSVQMGAYFENGPGGAALGDQREFAAAACRRIEAELEETAAEVAASQEALAGVRSSVRAWAEQHPIERSLAWRRSMTGVLAAQIESQSGGAFAVVGALGEDLEDLGSHINIYSRYLPKQVRWQAELLALDTLPPGALQGRMNRLDTLMESTTRAASTMARVPEILAAERSSALDGVRAERVAASRSLHVEIERLTAQLEKEREAILTALGEERVAAMQSLRQERIASFEALEALRGKMVDDAAERAGAILDRLFLQMALLLSGLFVLGFAGGFHFLRSIRRAG